MFINSYNNNSQLKYPIYNQGKKTSKMTFRSLDMKHYTLIIPSDHVYSTINQIALLESAHFIDAGNHTNRQFQNQLKRIEELAQAVAVMKRAAKLAGFTYDSLNEAEAGYMDNMKNYWVNEAKKLGVDDGKLIDYYQMQISQQYKTYEQTISALQKLKQRRNQILQKIAVTQTIHSFLGRKNFKERNDEYYQNYMGENMENISGVSYVVGLIGRQAQIKFNLMIYRISRGYACVRSLDQFQFPGLAGFPEKVVIVIYPASTTGVLERKLKRVIQMFCNSVTELDKYDLKSQPANDFQILNNQYHQTQNYLEMNEAELKTFFKRICSINYLDKWSTFIWKEKCVYQTLNKLQMRGHLVLGNIYVPKQKIPGLSIQLSRISPTPTLQQVPLITPPTAFNTNSYTTIAQDITDTYGVPRYKEMNPSIFTTVTFPFFFGVMFGDIGHGLVLLALGLYLVINDDWIRKEQGFLRAFSRLRYMVTMMGFFAFYCGWIYNDIIGFSYNIFGSCYDPTDIDPQETVHRLKPKPGCVYPIGIDPIWGRAQNQLVFVNSLKMKISVIIAIIHMTFGIIVKALNSLYFRKKLDFFFEFIPQVTFMVILFGYMDFLIIFKWLKPWDEKVGDIPPRQWAPSIISTMMNIGLAMGKTGDKPDGNSNMWGQRGNSWQDTLQFFILIIAFLCVPIMLLPKPIIEISHNKKRKRMANPLEMSEAESQVGLERSLLTSSQRLTSPSSVLEGDLSDSMVIGKQAAHHDASQIFVHQLIQTIQFVLGAVSNTASYLRLWALSLAHSQLAKVFFQKTLQNGLQTQGYLAIIPTFVFFWTLCWITFAVLMCMDTMQCFLHSLRLHWVEFQNKFYKGDGYKYQPVSVKLYIQQQKQQQSK